MIIINILSVKFGLLVVVIIVVEIVVVVVVVVVVVEEVVLVEDRVVFLVVEVVDVEIVVLLLLLVISDSVVNSSGFSVNSSALETAVLTTSFNSLVKLLNSINSVLVTDCSTWMVVLFWKFSKVSTKVDSWGEEVELDVINSLVFSILFESIEVKLLCKLVSLEIFVILVVVSTGFIVSEINSSLVVSKVTFKVSSVKNAALDESVKVVWEETDRFSVEFSSVCKSALVVCGTLVVTLEISFEVTRVVNISFDVISTGSTEETLGPDWFSSEVHSLFVVSARNSVADSNVWADVSVIVALEVSSLVSLIKEVSKLIALVVVDEFFVKGEEEVWYLVVVVVVMVVVIMVDVEVLVVFCEVDDGKDVVKLIQKNN